MYLVSQAPSLFHFSEAYRRLSTTVCLTEAMSMDSHFCRQPLMAKSLRLDM